MVLPASPSLRAALRAWPRGRDGGGSPGPALWSVSSTVPSGEVAAIRRARSWRPTSSGPRIISTTQRILGPVTVVDRPSPVLCETPAASGGACRRPRPCASGRRPVPESTPDHRARSAWGFHHDRGPGRSVDFRSRPHARASWVSASRDVALPPGSARVLLRRPRRGCTRTDAVVSALCRARGAARHQ